MLGEVQDMQGQEWLAGPHQGQDPVTSHHDAAYRPLAALIEYLGQDSKSMLSGQAVGQQIEGTAGEQSRIQILWIEEALQAERTLLGRTQRLQFRLIDNDILLGGIGVAGDDGAGFDLAVDRTMFLIADALAAAGMKLVEMNLLAGAGSG